MAVPVAALAKLAAAALSDEDTRLLWECEARNNLQAL